MEKIFQSTEESVSSDYINSEDNVTESSQSSTSYVVSENADEVYSNVFDIKNNQSGGGDYLDPEKVTKELSVTLKNTINSVKENTEKIANNTVNTLLTKEQQQNAKNNIQSFINNTQEVLQDPVKTINNASEKLTDIVGNAIEETEENNKKTTISNELQRQNAIKNKLNQGLSSNSLSPELIDQIVQKLTTEDINNINQKVKQSGGYRKKVINNDRRYYEKYLKYKLKYLELKYE
jgi:hypothetical protein